MNDALLKINLEIKEKSPILAAALINLHNVECSKEKIYIEKLSIGYLSIFELLKRKGQSLFLAKNLYSFNLGMPYSKGYISLNLSPIANRRASFYPSEMYVYEKLILSMLNLCVGRKTNFYKINIENTSCRNTKEKKVSREFLLRLMPEKFRDIVTYLPLSMVEEYEVTKKNPNLVKAREILCLPRVSFIEPVLYSLTINNVVTYGDVHGGSYGCYESKTPRELFEGVTVKYFSVPCNLYWPNFRASRNKVKYLAESILNGFLSLKSYKNKEKTLVILPIVTNINLEEVINKVTLVVSAFNKDSVVLRLHPLQQKNALAIFNEKLIELGYGCLENEETKKLWSVWRRYSRIVSLSAVGTALMELARTGKLYVFRSGLLAPLKKELIMALDSQENIYLAEGEDLVLVKKEFSEIYYAASVWYIFKFWIKTQLLEKKS